MTPRDLVAVTGANGFLGARLTRHLLERGHGVRALVRAPESCALEGVELRRFHMPAGIDAGSLEGAKLLIHCAATTRAKDRIGAEDVDELGSTRLFDAARAAGVERIVFLSSLSAHADALSHYGRSKCAIEAALDPQRDVALRLGLVLSRGGGGLFGRMVQWVGGMRVIPVFGGGTQPVQPIHEADVRRALDAVIERGVTGVLALADPAPIPFRDLLQEIARRLGRTCRLVSVPFAPALAAARVAERLRVPLPIGSENLLGLKAQKFVPCADDLTQLDLCLRPLAESLDDVLGALPERA